MEINWGFQSIRVSSEWRPLTESVSGVYLFPVSNQLGSPASGDISWLILSNSICANPSFPIN